MIRLRTKALRLLPALAAAVLAAGCGDLTGDDNDTLVYRVVITQTGSATPLVTVLANRTLTGSLSVQNGGTRQIDIVLEQQNGSPVPVGGNNEARVVVTNTVVADFVATGTGPGLLRGNLVGKSAGNTTLRVQYLEGGLIAYETPSISVTVN